MSACDSLKEMGAALWKINDRTFDLSATAMIMGVLNVTPDSFSDGGEFLASEPAIVRGRQMAAEGAQIVDIGGESTRPGAEPVTAEEELSRVLPVVTEVGKATGALISIDTTKAQVARAAMEAGASIINDVSGGREDKGMFQTVAETSAAFVIMHMQGTPRTMQKNPTYEDVVAEVGDFFRQQYARALDFGIDPMAIAFDPGIGFGKTLEHNLSLLANLPQLRIADRPLVVGVSRKSFLGKLVGSSDMADRAVPTIAFSALLRAGGANVLRVHDVKENVAAVRATEKFLKAAR